MSILRRILVGDQERVLLIRKGRFEKILEPGEYWIFGAGVQEIRFNVNELVFENVWANYIVKERPEVAARAFTIVETRDNEVALVFHDGKLARVLGPGKRALYWKAAIEITSDVIDVTAAPEIPKTLAATVHRLAHSSMVFATVEEGRTGLLSIDGRFVRSLAPGVYAFWNVGIVPRVDVI